MLLAVAALAVAAVLYAPYLPRLLLEGYPSPFWPAAGSFARIAGTDGAPPPIGSLAKPGRELLELFDAAKGRAILVARDGQMVIEHYGAGIDRESRLNSYSLVKSLVGLLVLKAIADGLIGDRDVNLASLLPEFTGKPIGDIAFCNVLDMRSGIGLEPDGAKSLGGPEVKDLEATRLNLFGPMGEMHMRGAAAMLPRLATSAGGSDACDSGSFSYQNVNTALAGLVLERVYRRPLEQILADAIWQPAGAAPADWRRHGEGLPATPYCCIYARPLDWLKVAIFIAANGAPGKPLLPEPLWRYYLGADIPAGDLADGSYRDFAYHNVLDRAGEPLQGPFTYFFGSRGQTVYLMPQQKLVVVRFGGAIQKLHSTLYAVGRSLEKP